MLFFVGYTDFRESNPFERAKVQIRPKLHIRDLLSATTATAVTLAIVLSGSKIVANPDAFVASLGHQTAALMMIACTLGIVVFPFLFLFVGYIAWNRSTSPLKLLYVVLLLGLAIASIPIAIIVARACAYSLA